MRAYMISDGEFLSQRHRELDSFFTKYLAGRGFSVEKKTIERDELAFCRGCFDCWTKTPGECAIRDGMTEINRNSIISDIVVYLCPVVFGQYSANMKSAIDRWLPNMLPFFMTRKDGSTMHPPRYRDYPKQIMVAYAENLSDEDGTLFRDIVQKHRNNVAVLIDSGDNASLAVALEPLSLCRIGGAL